MVSNVTYYVDESGDLNLFNKKGVPLSEGPAFIMLGLLKIKEPNFERLFYEFKNTILADPIFNTFSSIDRTKKNFHAKDDHIAIKREVFKFIKNIDFSVQIVIRRKPTLIEQAKSQFTTYGKKLTDRQIYNDLVSRLFKEKLHKADTYEIIFSQRGKSTETKSLRQALNKARDNFYASRGIHSNSTINITCSIPNKNPGLQVIDYCLWAVQRLYVKQEDVYFNLINDKYKLIIDVDDKKKNQYGEYYSSSNPLILDKIRG
jgi:hypothetical protein